MEQSRQPNNDGRPVGDNEQAGDHHQYEWHNTLDHLVCGDTSDLLRQEQAQTHRRRDKPQGQVEDDHDTEVHGVAAQLHGQHTQDGAHDHVDGVALHQHAQDEQQDVYEEQQDVLVVAEAQEEGGELGGDLVVGQHQAEDGGHGKHEQRGSGKHRGIHQDLEELLQGEGLVHEHADQNGVHGGHAGALGGGEVAGEDTHDQDHGHHHSGEGILEGDPDFMTAGFALQRIAVLLADEPAQHHLQQAHQDTGQQAADQQRADGHAGDRAVQHTGGAGRNDGRDGGGRCGDGGGERLIIASLLFWEKAA